MNVEIGARRRTIWKFTTIGGQANCNECGKRCRTMHNLKIHKLSDDESIAMILKEMQENAQFEDI